MELWSGVVLAFATLATGSFSIPLKLAHKNIPDLSDIVFQGYWALGVGLISVLTIPIQCELSDAGTCFSFVPLGILAALPSALVATLFVLVAVKHLGVGSPPSIIAATFIFAGVAQSWFVFKERPQNTLLLVLVLVLVLLAAIGVAFSKVLSHRSSKTSIELKQLELSSSPVQQDGNTSFPIGFLASIGVGICGSFAPFSAKFVKTTTPFGYVPSYGIGVVVVHLAAAFLLLSLMKFGAFQAPKHWRILESLPYGLVSGVLWGMGNAGVNFALTFGVPFTMAVSISQCALLISGVWGICLFGEIRGLLPVCVFFISAIVLLVGIFIEHEIS